MGREASKTKSVNPPDFYDRYFSGRVLDIGCGPDLVVPHAQPFDTPHGDANRILDYLDAESFDCVHSSHCLEHMYDAEACLAQWWQLVRPGGYLITVVPEETLYEQHLWPSRFNPDHKSTFRLDAVDSWSPVSHDVLRLHKGLEGAHILVAEVHDNGYDHTLVFPRGRHDKHRSGIVWRQLNSLTKKLPSGRFKARVQSWQVSLGYPVDQTIQNNASAQIQIVAQKANSPQKSPQKKAKKASG